MTGEATEIMPLKTRNRLDDEALSRLDFSALVAEMDSGAVNTVDISSLGNGFEVLDDKRQLVDVPFIIADYRFNGGQMGNFVTLFAVTKDNRKYIVNDGGSGIYRQMKSLHDKMNGEHAVIAVPKGLTVSDYDFVDGSGVTRPAATFYLSLSK